jgi:hypothetical protein
MYQQTMNIDRLKNATFSFYGISILIDHLTTIIGINHGLAETNLLTHSLMAAGQWTFIDLAIGVSLVLATHVLMKHNRTGYMFFLFFPFMAGVIRLLAGLNNIFLLM